MHDRMYSHMHKRWLMESKQGCAILCRLHHNVTHIGYCHTCSLPLQCRVLQADNVVRHVATYGMCQD